MSPTDIKRHKLFALGLGGALLLVLSLGLIAPLGASINDQRDAIETDRSRLQALRAKRANLAELEAKLKAIRARSTDQPAFLETLTSGAAWERLEATLRDLASNHGAEVVSTRMLRLEDDFGLKAVRGEVEISVPRAELTSLVAAIERHAPAIFVEKLRLLPGDGRNGDNRIRMTGAVRMLTMIAAPGPRR